MKMKNRWKQVISAVLAVCLLVMGVTGTANANEAGKVALKANKKYTGYDVNGDGKKDIIEIKDYISGDELSVINCTKVFVNGKCALTAKNGEWGYYDETIQLITLKNGKVYLFVYLSGEDGDGPIDIYEYKSGKFKKCINILNELKYVGYHTDAKVRKVDGNKLIITAGSMSYAVASVDMEWIYEYKNGKLQLASKNHKVLKYYAFDEDYNIKKGNTPYLTATKDLKLYPTYKAKNAAFLLKKGEQVKILSFYISGKTVRCKVKTKNGKIGWFVAPADTLEGVYFKEIVYAG